LIVRLGQIGETLRDISAAERIHVHEKAQAAKVNGEPFAVRVLQAFGNVIKTGGLVSRRNTLITGLDAGRHAVIGDIRDRAVFFGQELAQGLARVLVVMRHLHIDFLVDGFEHGCPIRPLRRAIVADGIFRRCRY